MKEQNALETYNSMPVAQAVVRNALPAMAAMLMTLIYNLADTFFILRSPLPFVSRFIESPVNE